MKTAALAIGALAFIAGCAAPGTITAPELETKDPLVYKYSGPPAKMKSTLKRELITRGFTIAEDDLDAGILMTAPKVLDMTERSVAGEMAIAAISGVETTQQRGIARFFYSGGPDSTEVELACLAEIDQRQQSAVFQNQLSTKSSSPTALIQGHMFTLKVGFMVDSIEGFDWLNRPADSLLKVTQDPWKKQPTTPAVKSAPDSGI